MAAAISLVGDPDDQQLSLKLTDECLCNICLIQASRYTCPRCNIHYCSLPCYKSQRHAQCSESFYKDCVVTDLKNTSTRSPEDRQHMMDMLHRLEEESQNELGSHDLEDLPLEDRLAGLDIENEGEKIWDNLTPEERREFQQLINSGAAGQILEIYTPWWEVSPRLVTPVDSTSRESFLPSLPQHLPPLASIKGGPVSPCVRYSVINVLFAYAYIVRFFNGEHRELPLQACQMAMDLSLCLSTNTVFTHLSDAIRSSLVAVQQNRDAFNSTGFSVSVLKDLSSIICSVKPRMCRGLRALSDLHGLLKMAYRDIKFRSCVTGVRKEMKLARKKIYFLLIWSKENEDLISTVKSALDFEIERTLQTSESSVEISNSMTHDSATTCCEQSIAHELIKEFD